MSVCPQLSITNGSPQIQSIAPEETATLTVSASGATSYQWYAGNGTIIAGQTSASFTTPSLTSTKTYYVKASNACGTTVTSRTADRPQSFAADGTRGDGQWHLVRLDLLECIDRRPSLRAGPKVEWLGFSPDSEPQASPH